MFSWDNGGLDERKDRIGALAFAQEDKFSEQQISLAEGPSEVGDLDVVNVNAAALNVLAGLPFRGGKLREHQGLGQWQRLARKPIGVSGQADGRDLADDVTKGGFTGVADLGSK